MNFNRVASRNLIAGEVGSRFMPMARLFSLSAIVGFRALEGVLLGAEEGFLDFFTAVEVVSTCLTRAEPESTRLIWNRRVPSQMEVVHVSRSRLLNIMSLGAIADLILAPWKRCCYRVSD